MGEKGYLQDSKTRFSSRVENYVKYRPSYPKEIISFLTKEGILSRSSVIADIGFGTGILTKLFLENSNKVYGVEPNDDMRKAGEFYLKRYPEFSSRKGTAESTGLSDNSIDLIIVGQAFHWFDIKLTKDEFKRILKKNGHVVIVWNTRKKSGSPFLEDYERLISKYGTDYKQVRMNEKAVDKFFENQIKVFYNFQDLTFEGFKGRLLSSSYIPLEKDPKFDEMINDLKDLFAKYQQNGIIRIDYDTKLYYGMLD
jgi:ubiquinone/menaquinone biosynthesis C-methylase UbiE